MTHTKENDNNNMRKKLGHSSLFQELRNSASDWNPLKRHSRKPSEPLYLPQLKEKQAKQPMERSPSFFRKSLVRTGSVPDNVENDGVGVGIGMIHKVVDKIMDP